MKIFKHLFTALLLLFCTVVNAHNFEVDGIYYNITDATNKTVAVTYRGNSYDSYSDEYTGNVVIPESVTYNGNTYSVTSIGYYAFQFCSGLTSIEIPNSVTSVGYEVFDGCSSLTSIVVEEGNTIYDSRDNCNAIIETSTNTLIVGCKSTVIPTSVTSIGDGAFAENSGLTSIEIPNSVTSIGRFAFFRCSGLTSIVIGNSVTSIGGSAFRFCSGLTSIVIGNSVTSIGGYAFEDCSGLTSVHISNLSAWCNIDFESSISNPLYYAKNLYLNGELVTELVIPDDVTEIKDYAFYNCTGLTSVVIPNSVTSIGRYAFDGTAWYNNQPNGLIYAGKVLYKYKGTMYNNTSITIKDGTLGIAGGAFYNCSKLTSIVIPNSLTSIGDRAFENCSGLTSIEIPNSVTSIGNYAFDGCTSLKDLRIEDGKSTLSLGYNGSSEGLFYDCPLERLYLGRNLSYNTDEGSGYSPFCNIKTLTSVTFGNSVTSIGDYAFKGCSGLTSIAIPNSVTSIAGSAFSYCTSLRDLRIEDGEGTLSLGYHTYDSSSTGKGLFYDCPLKTLYLGRDLSYDTTKSYGYSPFNRIKTLTSVTIGNSVTRIESEAFGSCSGLKSIVIPNSVTSIGGGAFYGCSKLTSIVIPNSLTSIGKNAFYNCSGLTSIVIPSSVTSIGDDAFYGCKNLKTVINDSNLNFEKGSKSYGYIAYYADIVITPVNGISPITSLAELSNSSVYYIYQHYHSKGSTSWAVATDGEALKSNKDLNIAIDENDTCQRFAILSIDGGVTRYLYHIATQMFVNLDGSLSATPGDAINFMAGKYENTFIAYFDNEHYVNVGDKQEMIIDDWDTPDGGNSCLIIPVGEFDPSNALEMFEDYTTEIDEMQGENEKVVYDLNGRRIVDAEYLEHGAYIINGRKVVK